MEYRIEIEGLEELKQKCAVADFIKYPIKEFLKGMAADIILKAKEKVPVDRGGLKSSIGSRFGENEVIIGSNIKYAPMVEFGTKPHTIVPRLKRVLAFQAGGKLGRGKRRRGRTQMIGGGEWIFTQMVHHPGTKAKPFLIPAAEEVNVEKEFEKFREEVEKRWQNG